jgi:CubicO group peptidase (beta-lactamase class C family)
MTRLFAAILAASICQPAFAETSDEQLHMEADEAFERLAPVGMAVAVVRPGQPVWVKGYGSLTAGEEATVEGDTVFPIHSMTKSFTAAALALLVEEGKVAWSDPVRKHIPEFAMSDPYVTENLTVRDLLVHNSGLALGAGDLLHWPDQVASPREFIAALRHLPLEQGFREGFAYDNILYIVAGEVVARASGKSWAEFVETRLFAPLGMTSCSTSSARARAVPTVTQHSRQSGGLPTRRDDIVLLEDPAGSISCSVRDMAKWTEFQLGDGKLANGSVLMTGERLREMHKPVVALGPPNFMRRLAGAHFNDVALGWFTLDFAGTLAVEHGGLGAGGISNMILLPEKDAAVVVLVNDLIPAQFLSHQLADLIARGDQASDWIGYFVEGEKRRAARAAQENAQVSQPPPGAASPAHGLADYAGTYRDPWYGDIIVRAGDEGLTLHFTRSKLLNGPLLPWDGETFLARWPDRSLEADAMVTFITDEAGKVSGMQLVAASERTDFSYDYHHLAPKRVRD